jgi:hypothetical protein
MVKKPNIVDINMGREAEFIVPAHDGNGDKSTLFCNVTPALNRLIDRLITTGRFPFRSKGDLVRWCIKTGVDRLAVAAPEVGDLATQVNVAIKILQRVQHHREQAAVIQSLVIEVDVDLKNGDIDSARASVLEVRDALAKISSDRWRKRYLNEIDSRFANLLSLPGADLGDPIDSGPDLGIDEEDGDGDG